MSHFGNPWVMIAVIAATGLLYVVLPVVGLTFRRYRDPQILTCPETGDRAAVIVDAKKAALTAAVGEPRLQAMNCSLWPQHKSCGQSCLKRA